MDDIKAYVAGLQPYEVLRRFGELDFSLSMSPDLAEVRRAQ